MTENRRIHLPRPSVGSASRAKVEPLREFSIDLELPPSTNALYSKRSSRQGGGLALTKEARRFQRVVKKSMEPHLASLNRFPVGPEEVYQFNIILYFDKLENPGWFERWKEDTYVTRGKQKGELKGKKGERKAKTRYKVIDYDNRIKFLQDCVVEAIGIPNDCQVFRGLQEKREDPRNPRAAVTILVVDRDEFFERR